MMGRTSTLTRIGGCGAAFLLLASASTAQEGAAGGRGASLPPVRAEGGHRPQVTRDREGNLVLRNRHLVAVMRKGASGGYGEVALYPNPRPGTEVLEPAATVRLSAGGSSEALQAEVKGERVLLTTPVAVSAGRLAGVTLQIGDEPWLSWEASLGAGGAAEASTPISLLAGYPGPREALFPGVAYTDGTEPARAAPLTPDPLRVTVPLMAHSQDGTTVALLWAPRGAAGAPRALFDPEPEGPTRMELSVPASSAAAPGAEPRLSGKLLVLRDTPDPSEAIRQWTKAYPLTRSPEYPRSFADERRLSRQAFTRALWSADAPGWRVSADAAEARPYSFGVQALLMDAALEKNRAVSAELRQQAERVLAVLRERGPLDPGLAYRVGGVRAGLDAEADRVMELAATQLPEGGWLPASASRPDGGDSFAALAEAGIVAANAIPILRYAALTGDSAAAGAGRRAVEYLDRLRLPGSAGSGSTPPGAPELLTAARVAECFFLAYQMNGNREYLRQARYWADTGLGFVYLWSDAARPAMRFAAVPVMSAEQAGPALASPAAGLEYARVLYALHTVRRDDLYETIAEGILASAMRQQSASGDAAGLLPEFWNVKDGVPEGRQLNPWPLLEVMHRVAGHNPDASQARVRVGSDRMFVASGAAIPGATTTSMRLRLKLRGLPGSHATTTVAGVPALPLRVEYNSTSPLPFGIKTDHRLLPEGAPEADGSWTYDPDTGLLTVRVRHTGDDDHLEIRWPDPRERAPVKPADRAIRPRR